MQYVIKSFSFITLKMYYGSTKNNIKKTLYAMMVTGFEKIFLLFFLRNVKKNIFFEKGVFDFMNGKHLLLSNCPFIQMSRKTFYINIILLFCRHTQKNFCGGIAPDPNQGFALDALGLTALPRCP